MENQLKVSIYIRVSTSKQANEGDSLDEQEKELKKFCEYKGYLIHKIHIEAGRSAKDTNRPEYQRLMKDIEGEKINAVIVKKLDRLSRSLLDFEGFMITAQKHNVEFISLKENFDTTTAMGKAMLRVALVFAQLEREQTAERITDVMNYRAEQGLRNGGVTPYGYDLINKEMLPHKQEKKVFLLMVEHFLKTRSTVAVASMLNEAGFKNRSGKLWDCRRIEKMLKSPLYKGQMIWGKRVYAGIHQPLISEAQFEEIQTRFRHILSKPLESTGKALLRGLLTCGHCDSVMTPSSSYNHRKLKYYYYRCVSTVTASGRRRKKCEYKYVGFKVIDSRILNLLLSFSQEQGFNVLENQILKYNQEQERDEQKIKADLSALEHRMELIKANKDRYLDSLISSQFLSTERKKINEKMEELELEEKQVKAIIYKQQFELNQKEATKIDLASFKQELITFRKDYDTYTPEELRRAILNLIKGITYHPDKLLIHFHRLPWPMEFSG
jgi:site-specific DNA recombinase